MSPSDPRPAVSPMPNSVSSAGLRSESEQNLRLEREKADRLIARAKEFPDEWPEDAIDAWNAPPLQSEAEPGPVTPAREAAPTTTSPPDGLAGPLSGLIPRIVRSTLVTPRRGSGTLLAMPELLAALIAFVSEHRACGQLAGGLERGMVWLACSCGAELVRPASPPTAGEGTGGDQVEGRPSSR